MDLSELKKLNLPRNKFAVFGSVPLAIRKLREARDIDIVVKQDLRRELAQKYAVKKRKTTVYSNRGHRNIQGVAAIWRC